MHGITVNGMPLNSFLEKECDKEINSHMRHEVNSHNLYKRPHIKYKAKSERNSKVRYLTRKEIEEEYGMKKISKTRHMINVIHSFKGEFTIKDIVKKCNFDKKNQTPSAILANIYKALQDTYLTRKKEGTLYVYSSTDKGINATTEELYNLYREYVNKKNYVQRNGKKEASPMSVLANKVKEIGSTGDINIKLDVTVKFGFIK